MSRCEQDFVEIYCPGCRETSAISKLRVGEFLACPACGLSIAATHTPDPVEPAVNAALEQAYREQQKASLTFRQTVGVRRVEVRTFRLKLFDTWEAAFARATEFANTLAPEAVINISHAWGDGWNTSGVAVVYWTITPLDSPKEE